MRRTWRAAGCRAVALWRSNAQKSYGDAKVLLAGVSSPFGWVVNPPCFATGNRNPPYGWLAPAGSFDRPCCPLMKALRLFAGGGNNGVGGVSCN